MADPVLTGAIALIKVRGSVVGRMRNIRATENIQRGDVRGIGTILRQEAPAIAHNGTLTCSFYEIDFTSTGLPNALKRRVQTNQQFEDNILLDEEGLQIDIFKKLKDIIDADGNVIPKVVPYAIIKRCFIDNENFDISEGQVSGHDQSFIFLDPIIRPS